MALLYENDVDVGGARKRKPRKPSDSDNDMGGAALSAAAVAGRSKYQEVIKKLKAMGHPKPVLAYRALKAKYGDLDSVAKHLHEAKGGARPKAAAPKEMGGVGLGGMDLGGVHYALTRMTAAERKKLARMLKGGAASKGGDIWDTIKDVAETAAPFLPLLL